jgi:hypothetical protein
MRSEPAGAEVGFRAVRRFFSERPSSRVIHLMRGFLLKEEGRVRGIRTNGFERLTSCISFGS